MSIRDFLILFLFTNLFGAIIGAYFGTIEYRIRMNLPLVTAKCICPACGHSLPLMHQIPILSWIILRRRCFFCHDLISIRYPLIETSFLLFYAASFVLFYKMPFILISSWFLFITVMLLIRSHKHYVSMLKGLSIMYLYHLIYGTLLVLLLSIL